MSYLILKFIHIIGAVVIMGTGTGIAFFMVMAHRSKDPAFIAKTASTVVVADKVFTLTAIIVQPISGYFLMREIGASFGDFWIVASIGLFIVAGVFWLPVVWMQMRMRDLARAAVSQGSALPDQYYTLYRRWFLFGFPGFGAITAIIWLMISKPI